MPEFTLDELREQLAAAEVRAALAEGRASMLEAELERTREWRKWTLLAVVVVASLAILMLGVVAFNAADSEVTIGQLH